MNVYPDNRLALADTKILIVTSPNPISFDNEFGRLDTHPNKFQVRCPAQASDVGVLLVIGQSNSANYAAHKHATAYPKRVFNYHKGDCFIASSPLLGAAGEGGEFITMLADNLITNGTYKSIVIISSGIGGVPISPWRQGNNLNKMLLKTIDTFDNQYKVTEIIWHQGETDFNLNTGTKFYIDSFQSLLYSMEKKGISAKAFIAVATRCGDKNSWTYNNSVANAQRLLVDNKKIFMGADTDLLLGEGDRDAVDHCHLSQDGQEKTAKAYSDAISNVHKNMDVALMPPRFLCDYFLRSICNELFISRK